MELSSSPDFNSRLATQMAEALGSLVERVQRSLVVIQSGKHGAGAGIIYRSDGLILTNQHVARHGRLVVILPDDHAGQRSSVRKLPAHILAQDPDIDLALVQVVLPEGDPGVQPASLADSRSLRVGQFVLAIGHPWGERNFVSSGIISGFTSAMTRGRQEVQVLRTDVRLAPGNSGGPLVNSAGAVVGLNTMIVGGDQGIAIPSNLMNAFAERAVQELPYNVTHGTLFSRYKRVVR